MSDDTKNDTMDLDDVRTRVDDVRVAMVATLERDGSLSSRPLTVQRITDDGNVEFLVERDAGWAEGGQAVDVALVDDGRTWVSVSGTAEYLLDPIAVEHLWDEFSEQFFDDRSDAVVMRVHATTWSYWAAPNRVAQVFELAKAFLTDRTPDLGDSGTIAV